MKLKQIAITTAGVALVLVTASFTAPIWGGCGVNASVCSSWCSMRYFNSDIKRATCKAGCGADRLACMAK